MLFNCDMGEALSPSPDEHVMPHIHLANVACGGHAGDETSMQATVQLAKRYQVKVGAHPSYPDKLNFGRRSIDMPPETLAQHLVEQIQSLQTICELYHLPLHHVKAHGALYLDMLKDLSLLNLLLSVMQTHFPKVPLMVQGGIDNAFFESHAKPYQVPLIFEAFADRAYLDNGHLAPRSTPNSLYQDEAQIHDQIDRFHQANWAQTLCFHSDNPASVMALQTYAPSNRTAE